MQRPDADIAFVLLAAGHSKRFGGDKLASQFNGKPLYRWAVEAADRAGFPSRYLVTGAHSSISAPDGWQEVANRHASEGMGTSIAAGVAAARHHPRLVIGLADMPKMTATHLCRLATGDTPIFTRQDDGSPGCPAAFGRDSYADLMTLTGDRGARALAGENANVIDPANKSLLFDVDTPEDLGG